MNLGKGEVVVVGAVRTGRRETIVRKYCMREESVFNKKIECHFKCLCDNTFWWYNFCKMSLCLGKQNEINRLHRNCPNIKNMKFLNCSYFI